MAGVLGACLMSAWAVEVEPEALAFHASPGGRATASLWVRNDTLSPLKATLTWEAPDGASWLNLAPRAIRLKPGEKKEIRVTARPPKVGGGERTALLVVIVPGPKDSEIRVVRRVALVIAGTERPEASVETLSARVIGSEARLRAVVRNDGNVTLRIKTGAELFFTNGRRLRASPSDVGAVSPSTTGEFDLRVPLQGEPWGGRGRVWIYFLNNRGRTTAVEKEFGPEVLTR